MGKFYLDMEWTNGNFYLGDIFEVAVVSEDSGNIFHSYIKLHHKLPYHVKFLCSITDERLQYGDTFKKMFKDLLQFLESEGSTPIIVAHGGYYYDFPMLISNCMKHKCDFSRFENYVFIDSVMLLQMHGYQKTALETLTKQCIKHSALEDVKALKGLFEEEQYRVMLENHKGYSLEELSQYISEKLPVGIQRIYELARRCKTHYYLRLILEQYVKERTALNGRQVYKIACQYFYDSLLL